MNFSRLPPLTGSCIHSGLAVIIALAASLPWHVVHSLFYIPTHNKFQNMGGKLTHSMLQRLSHSLILSIYIPSASPQLAGFEATQALGASSVITHFTTGTPGFWQRARKETQFLNSCTKVNTFTCENLPLTPVKPVAAQASIMCLSLAVQILLWHSLAP